jgi:hypothetical protein
MVEMTDLKKRVKQDAHDTLDATLNAILPEVRAEYKRHLQACVTFHLSIQKFEQSANRVLEYGDKISKIDAEYR